MRRRDALKWGLGAAAATAAAATLPRQTFAGDHPHDAPAATSWKIAPVTVQLASNISVRSIAFVGPASAAQSAPPPASQLQLHNDTASGIVVHSAAPSQPWITLPAGGRSRLPASKSCRAYCAASGAIAAGPAFPSTAFAPSDFTASDFARTQRLSIHRWQPRPVTHADPVQHSGLRYAYASFGDKLLPASEPLKVREGERIFFHILNLSTQGVTLALPQHQFRIIALDGHEVPTPRLVERLYLGPFDSVGALVAMDRPGRWILGATHRADRAAGLGRLIEYAGASGRPVHAGYGAADWDYSRFGAVAVPSMRNAVPLPSLQLIRREHAAPQPRDALHDPTPQLQPLDVSAEARHRLRVTNLTRSPQTLSLLGHDLELASVAGKPAGGVRKQVVTLPSFTRIEFEFDARARRVFLAHDRLTAIRREA